MKIYKDSTKEQYSPLIIDNRGQYPVFQKGFDYIYDIDLESSSEEISNSSSSDSSSDSSSNSSSDISSDSSDSDDSYHGKKKDHGNIAKKEARITLRQIYEKTKKK